MSPSRPEPLLGYRWWWAFRDAAGRPRIRAWVWDIWWNCPGITRAVHWDEGTRAPAAGLLHLGSVPGQECICGIYAWFRLPTAITNIVRFTKFDGDKDGCYAVAGAVVTGGTTIVHGDEGMRVQLARPVAFAGRNDPEDADQRLIPDLAEHYGVPVMPLDKLERYAREFGMIIEEEQA